MYTCETHPWKQHMLPNRQDQSEALHPLDGMKEVFPDGKGMDTCLWGVCFCFLPSISLLFCSEFLSFSLGNLFSPTSHQEGLISSPWPPPALGMGTWLRPGQWVSVLRFTLELLNPGWDEGWGVAPSVAEPAGRGPGAVGGHLLVHKARLPQTQANTEEIRT